MRNIIGISLIPGCIEAACLRNGNPVLFPKEKPYPKEDGVYEAIQEAARKAGMTEGDLPAEAVCVAPACMTHEEKAKFQYHYISSHLHIRRFLPPTVAAALRDYYRRKGFYDQRDETIALVCADIGSFFEVAVLNIGGDVLEVLAVQSEENCGYYDQYGLLNRVLDAAKIGVNMINRLLMVGELIPEVQDDLPDFCSEAFAETRPWEDAVLGAALYGGKLSGAGPEALIINAQANTLGIETFRTEMVQANTSIATCKAKVFTNAQKDQTGMNLLIYEEVWRHRSLALPERIPVHSYHIKDLPPVPKGEARIEVTVDLDTGGKIKIRARDLVRGRQLELHPGIDQSLPYPVEWEEEETDAGNKESLIREMLPIYDDLERAMLQPTSDAAYKRGVELTMKKLTDTLKRLGAEPYGQTGEQFDPKLHEAAVLIHDINLDSNTVSRVYRKGFRLNGRIIRYAMVQVAN